MQITKEEFIVISFIVGLFVGGFLGVAIMCCLFAGKQTDIAMGIEQMQREVKNAF